MEKKEQVFLYMKEEIERLANLEEEKILAEAKELEEEAYNQIKAEAKKDAEALLAKELVEISSSASVEASLSQEEKTKKLVAFVASKDYQKYLIEHIEKIGKLYQMEDSTLELREEDMRYKDELVKAYGVDLEVEVSDKIKIGGFIIENKATNVVVDESLDSALENQKDWFYKTSGLMIK